MKLSLPFSSSLKKSSPSIKLLYSLSGYAFNKLYRTGDFGSYENGIIFYRGRTDSQIKIRGHRVDLSEIEKAFQTLSEIQKVVVLCHHQGEIDQAVLAFVNLNDGQNISTNKILDHLETKLQAYMIPQIIIIDKFPLLVNGKVDRQRLLNSSVTINNNNEGDFVADLDFSGVPDHYKQMCTDLYEVVQCSIGPSAFKSLSLKSNFYEIGGNSLNSIYTITLLRERAELESLLKPDIYRQDYCDVIDDIWEILVAKEMSFIVKDMNSKEVIGTSLNFDARDEPEVEIKSKLSIIFDFLEHVEGPVRDNQLPEGRNSIFHAFMMGTSEKLSGQENIACMHFMEYEQMGTEIFHYESLLEYPINRYVHRDGTKPFGKAKDSETVIVAWKPIPSEK
uniref:AMP-binding enzyme C-terminal domain-containing protein n=1 Tax=Megaselia scalaris TaxID=36166 RepID=T1GFF7_MEGSC